MTRRIGVFPDSGWFGMVQEDIADFENDCCSNTVFRAPERKPFAVDAAYTESR
jgi:hypothetical protein